LAGNRLKTIRSWEEVPEFKSEREEHEFWGSHSLSEEMLENFHPPQRASCRRSGRRRNRARARVRSP
jgi:hypothetical protein